MPTFDDQMKSLGELRLKEEEDAVKRKANSFNIPYIDLSGIGVDTDALKVLPEETSKKLLLAGFKLVGKQLHLAAINPETKEVRAAVDDLSAQGYISTVYIASTRSLEKAWDRYQDIHLTSATQGNFLDISNKSLREIADSVQSIGDVEKLFTETLTNSPDHQISRLLEVILGSAISLGASDVHIEPQEERVRLRYRLDGVLQDVVFFKASIQRKLNSRLKLLSHMKLTTNATAQDGRFTIDFNDLEIEIRSSIVPGAYGESIVMRILNPEGIALPFEELGFESHLLDILKEEIKKPNGLILTTGPTGSGKTTTLYSFLRHIYTPTIKIITIEDPIEYHLEGITQTPVDHDKGYDFLSGLRAALRQDPDVIMVGEIRDNETATIAINSSLTGHLVISTLHTNNAAGAIPRLLDLGIKPSILAAALTVSMAQRLLRRLCTKCRKQVPADPKSANVIKAVLKKAQHNNKPVDTYGPVDISGDVQIYEAAGCSECNNTGYKGRVGIYEAILTDEHIEELLEKHPTEREIREASEKQGILNMAEDAMLKVYHGVTSLEEALDKVEIPRELVEEMENVETETPVVVASESKTTATSGEIAAPTRSYKSTELALLVDYLKTLEHEQTEHPAVDATEKIKRAKDTIIALLENTPEEELFAAKSEEQVVGEEINKLVADLHELEEHQKQNPTHGIAEKIKQARNLIESIAL